MTKRQELIHFLETFTTDNRMETFNRVLDNRTRYISVVLEDIFQPQNASAVLRSCDCFGIQNVHIIENRNTYNVNPDVAMGSNKWIDMNKYNATENNTLNTIKSLKKKGYRIVATTPHINDVSLPDFDLSKGKLALMFGTELSGLSDVALENADEYLKIPMYGFTESFNISVSASIILHYLTQGLHQSELNWKLTQNEKEELKLYWLRKSLKKSGLLIDEFCRKHSLDKASVI